MQDKHLFAKTVDGQIYRDHDGDWVSSQQVQDALNGKLMPSTYHVYHYTSDEQWQRVLAFPVHQQYDMRIQTEVEIINSLYGICRRCRLQPADGLWKGRFPIQHDTTGELIRTSPYKGYICMQCAQNLEENTDIKGEWLKLS